MTDEPLAPVPAGIDSEAWRSVTEAARAYCGWHIAPTITETIILDGSGDRTILLPSLRVVEVTSVKNLGVEVSLTDTTRWDWSRLTGVLRLYYEPFPWQLGSVEVEMRHGFDSCPTDLLDVCATVAARADMDVASMTGRFMAGPFQYDSSAEVRSGLTAFTDLQTRVLDRYRIPLRP